MKKSSLYFLALTVALLSSGCASFRVKTDLLPESDVKLKSPVGAFYIAKLKYDYDDGGSVTTEVQSIDAAYERKLLKLVRKECLARYPLLFSEEEYSAIPLFVTVKDKNEIIAIKTVAWILCTVCIVGTVLPMPVENNRELAVSASIWNGTDGQGSTAARKNFRREERGWGSMLTPLGLIPVPGESDFPKESEAFGMGRQMVDDTQQVAQQLATALAKMIESKDPEFWKATPLRSQQPGYAPTTPLTTPPSLPPPSETVTPF